MKRRDESLNREIQDYLERETLDNIAAGMNPEDARLAARRKLGPELRIKEDTRAALLGPVWTWIERLWQDLRHGAHMFRKNPGFALIAVISIAFGTGANVAMFSVADALLLRPLPVPRPDEVLTAGSDFSTGDFGWMLESYPNYTDLRDRNRTFAALAAFRGIDAGLAARPGITPQMKMGMLVSPNFFDAMSVAPERGRGFLDGEEQVVMLTHALWVGLGSDPAILGRTVWIDGISFTVIGVVPESFSGPDRQHRPMFYAPLAIWPRLTGEPHVLEARDLWRLNVKGRLRPGVTLTQAQADFDRIGRELEREFPDANRGRRAMVRTEVQASMRQNRMYTALSGILTLLAVAVLIVACANVAGLLTSRAPVRAREIALRLAIGAGRPRLIRQLLTESSLIAAAGGLLGIPVGYTGIAVLRQIQFPTDRIIVPVVEMDHRTLLFSILIAMLSTVLCGLVPAIQTTRADLTTALKASAVPAQSRRLWGRNLLVSIQVAVSLVLLTIAVFVYQGFSSDLKRGLGFRVDHGAMLSIDPQLVRYTPAQSKLFFERLTERAAAASGVKSAALASGAPMSLVEVSWVQPEGHEFIEGRNGAAVYSSRVDEHYFDTMGIKILEGRAFTTQDAAGAPRVAVINDTLAAHYWPGQRPLGKRFHMSDVGGEWVEVVGVTPTSRYLFVGEPPTEFLYVPYRQAPPANLTLLVAASGDSASVIEPLREVVRSLDPNMPVYDVYTMEQFVWAQATSVAQITVNIIGAMGLMGLTLSMIGLYGLMSYSVSRRTREIGIRMAIGADRSGVLSMILRQGLRPAVWGIALGLALSYLSGRLLMVAFPLNQKIGPESYGVVAVMLLLVAMVAALIPARRAALVDPMTALRDE